jgi:DNA-binding MarR family transcriptional regulator
MEWGTASTLDGQLRQLGDWQRRHLPCLHSALGQQMLAWLIEHNARPRPFGELVASTRFSTTSVRHLLNQFVVLGLIEVRANPLARRRGEIVATPRLRQRLEEYSERIKLIVAQHRGEAPRSYVFAPPPGAPGTAPGVGQRHRAYNVRIRTEP